MASPTLVKVLLALLPSVVIAVMQTTMIRASMTAYSTAVGPSSRFRNSETAWYREFIEHLLLVQSRRNTHGVLDPPRRAPEHSGAMRKTWCRLYTETASGPLRSAT